MSGVKMMMFDNGTDLGIRCRFISEWYKVDTYVSDKEGLLIVWLDDFQGKIKYFKNSPGSLADCFFLGTGLRGL